MKHLSTMSSEETPRTPESALEQLEQTGAEKTQNVEAVTDQAGADLMVDPLLAEIGSPAPGESGLGLNRPAFHPTFGYGFVTAIDDDYVTFREKRGNAATYRVKALDLITKSQAQAGFESCYFDGGAKAWRRAAGRWASLCKNLCLMEGTGVYGAWLDQHDLSRSSMDDLIRRFENEATWAAQNFVLPDSGNTDQPYAAPATPTSVYSVTGCCRENERTPDPENDARQKNIEAETSKRVGIKPTYHKTVLYLQRRHLDPDKLGLYHTIRQAAKSQVDTLMQRKIDEGFEEVLALAPATPPAQPDAPPSLTTDDPVATPANTNDVPDTGAPQVKDRADEVRSACLNLGFKSKQVKHVLFSPGLDFDEMMRQALKQLKPKEEKESETCTR